MTNENSSTGVTTRCQFQFTDGRRCRMSRHPDHSSLCPFHAREELQARESQRLGAEISVSLNGDFLSSRSITSSTIGTACSPKPPHSPGLPPSPFPSPPPVPSRSHLNQIPPVAQALLPVRH